MLLIQPDFFYTKSLNENIIIVNIVKSIIFKHFFRKI